MGEDEGDGNGTIYTLKVDQVLAGIRAISPLDQMYTILDRGRVDMHSCLRIGLPDPTLSGKIKMAFKAHLVKGHGRGGHVAYLRQQMTKMGPDINEVLVDMGKRIFGGHSLDLAERSVWRDLFGRTQPARAEAKDRVTAMIWLQKGATRSTLEDAIKECHELQRAEAFRARPYPKTDPRKLTAARRGSAHAG